MRNGFTSFRKRGGFAKFPVSYLLNFYVTYLEVRVFDGMLEFLEAAFWVSIPNSCPSLITAIRLTPFSRIIFKASVIVFPLLNVTNGVKPRSWASVFSGSLFCTAISLRRSLSFIMPMGSFPSHIKTELTLF